MHDLVIRNAHLIDGTGAPARLADIAIDGAVIVEVGRNVGAGRRTLDAQERLVTPGFVDIHTHYDAQVTWDPYLTPSSWHGCTTVVMGSCGVGFAPAAPDKHDWLIGLMEGVEDIPGAALHEGITWGWESFPEYLDVIAQVPHAIDFGAQVPHGAVRGYVMGERGADNAPATGEDIAAMQDIVHEALRAGALGFSTSRTLLHRSVSGEPVPGTFAGREELFGIGRAIQRAGHGVFQLASEHVKMASEFEWMRDLAREIGCPVMFNLSQTDQAPDLWRELLGLLDAAAEEGLEVYGQVAGRAIGVMMSFHSTANPFVPYPSFLKLMPLSREERTAALRDPSFRTRVLAEEPISIGPFEDFVTQSFHKMYPAKDGVDYEPDPDSSVAAIAERAGKTPQEIAYDLLMDDDTAGMLYFPLFNYADGNLDALHALHTHPRTRMGLSDAGAHCGAICDGGMPTFMLTHWSRDRRRGEKIPLPHIIKRQTSETARSFGLFDRGIVAPGYKADLNIIDYDALALDKPKLVYDLPAGGRRLVQRAKGYVATVCSGVVIVEDDTFTGALPGRLLRGPKASPAKSSAHRAA